jgi:hypothetical protein
VNNESHPVVRKNPGWKVKSILFSQIVRKQAIVMNSKRHWITAGGLCLGLILTGCDNSDSSPPPPVTTTDTPNILFIILDDIGIDQFRSFGYGGVTPPALPNIDQDRRFAGIHFRNTLVHARLLGESRGIFQRAFSAPHQPATRRWDPMTWPIPCSHPWEMTLPKVAETA